MLIAIAALALAVQAPAGDHRAEVERAVFELCPAAIAGTLSLADPAQVAAAGYTPAGLRQTSAGANPRVSRGTGTDKIVISIGGEAPTRLCSVWFGGPDNRRLADQVRSRARSSGYRGGAAGRLGDGTQMHNYRLRGDTSRSLVMIDADAGGELDFDPGTTVILMSGVN
ncbi:MAG: hypothetical protein QOD42_145 [Sphingomonadales bacterium]|jgi:hypothetical protein|nr:hypothetical protein [Sphingomonadales bacterium]